MDYQELFPVPVEWLQDTDKSIASTVAAWADAEVIPGRLEHHEDYDSLLAPSMRKLLVDIGLQSIFFPGEGGGADTAEAAMALVAVLEQVARADTGIAFILANTLAVESAFAVQPNVSEGLVQEYQQKACGQELFTGSLVLPAYSGPGRGDLFGLPYQATAEKTGNGWVLSSPGARPQCSGRTASFFGVFCDVDGQPGLCLVDREAGGLEAGETIVKAGLAASINSDIRLSSVTVPERRMVFAGLERCRETLSWYYALCSASCVGSLLAVHSILKEWGDTRVIKGKGQVFKENPLVASLLGEIGGKMLVARNLTYTLGRVISRPDIYGSAGKPANAALATTTFRHVAGMAMDAMDNAMELMGSAGYATEWNLERYWRDVKTLETYVTPETVARTDMARHFFDLKKL